MSYVHQFYDHAGDVTQEMRWSAPYYTETAPDEIEVLFAENSDGTEVTEVKITYDGGSAVLWKHVGHGPPT